MTDCEHAEIVAETRAVTRVFGSMRALDRVSVQAPRGRVLGLVGENGAGKTTLIRLLLGLLEPTSGAVEVFGRNPARDPAGVLAKLGYLSENRDLPGWMRVRELVWYTRAFYPGWDDAYAAELMETFGLDPEARVKTLSRGQRAQAGLLAALAHRPPLLLLDEPSSGLDPVVRREILCAVIRGVADEGRTVVFSSHLLDEVERIADDVALIHQGRLILASPLDAVKARYRWVALRFPEPLATAPALPGAAACEGRGREWSVLCDGSVDEVCAAAQRLRAEVMEQTAATLEDIFVAYAGGRARREKE